MSEEKNKNNLKKAMEHLILNVIKKWVDKNLGNEVKGVVWTAMEEERKTQIKSKNISKNIDLYDLVEEIKSHPSALDNLTQGIVPVVKELLENDKNFYDSIVDYVKKKIYEELGLK